MPKTKWLQNESREALVERITNPVLTLGQAAKLMGVCGNTLRKYANMGRIAHHRTPGGQRRFMLEDIMRAMELRAQWGHRNHTNPAPPDTTNGGE